ncbi:MAG: rRNA synthase [Gaiellaceae bacterium]|nr:rRNA synthase [Gaiellaceae bacterium]
METPDATRINRFLAAAGVASRRAADTMVEAGRVRIDGVVAETGSQVHPGQKVTLDGNPVYAERKVYLLLNKPGGVVTTASDPQNRPTVLDHIKVRQRVFPVGRLDSGTTGLLLMTNDGALAERLMHPRYGVEKTYHALVKGLVPEEVAAQLAAGVELDDGPTQPATVKIVGRDAGGSVLEFVLKEGRNRQIRRMCDVVGYHVRALRRTGYGPLRLGDMEPGASRNLTQTERTALLRLAGLDTGEPVRSRRPGSRPGSRPVKPRPGKKDRH